MGQDRSGSAAAPSGTEAGLHYLEEAALHGGWEGRGATVAAGGVAGRRFLGRDFLRRPRGCPLLTARCCLSLVTAIGEDSKAGPRTPRCDLAEGGLRRLGSPRGDGGALDRGAGEWTLRARSDLPTWPGRTAVLAGGGLCLGALSSAGRCLGASGGRRLCSVWEPRLGAPYGGSYFCQSLGRRVKGRDVPARVPPLKPTPEAWKDPRGGAQAAQSRDLSAC